MAKVPLNEYEFPMAKIANVQSQVHLVANSFFVDLWLSTGANKQLEQLVEKNYYLNKSGKDAYRSYLQAYASHSLKNVCTMVFSTHSTKLNCQFLNVCRFLM